MDRSTKFFTLFTELPPELRLQIWKLTIPSARIINIQGVEKDKNIRYGPYNKRYTLKTKILGLCRVPALLHVNSEARAVGLEHYKLVGLFIFYGKPIYLNFSTDIIYLANARAALMLAAIADHKTGLPAFNHERLYFNGAVQQLLVDNSTMKIGQGRFGTEVILQTFENRRTLVIAGEQKVRQAQRVCVIKNAGGENLGFSVMTLPLNARGEAVGIERAFTRMAL